MIELIEDTIDKAIVKDESISVSSSKYYCKFGNFRDNLIFANIHKFVTLRK